MVLLDSEWLVLWKVQELSRVNGHNKRTKKIGGFMLRKTRAGFVMAGCFVMVIVDLAFWIITV